MNTLKMFLTVLVHIVCVTGASRFAGASLYSDTVLADNPTLYWRLNDASNSVTAMDSAPLNGSQDGVIRHGLTPGGVTNGVPGLRPPTFGGLEATNTATSFNGAGGSSFNSTATDNIRVDTTPTLFGNVYSTEFWFNDSRPFDQLLATGYMFSRMDINSPNSFDAVGLTGTDGSVPHTLQFFTGAPSYNLLRGTTVLSTGVWYHVVFVRSNTSVSLYLNGVLDATGTASISYGSTSNTFLMGFRPDGSWTYQGLLDEVAIYNYALTASQIEAHFDAAPEPSALALLGLAGATLLAACRR